MSRAIKMVSICKDVMALRKETGKEVKVVFQCANNYPYILSGAFDLSEIFEFNSKISKLTSGYAHSFKGSGLRLVELSDDFIPYHQLVNPESTINKGRFIKTVERAAAEEGLVIGAMGTGAEFSYAHPKAQKTAFFDLPKEGQKYWLKIFSSWAKYAEVLGLELYTGRRPGILGREKSFVETIRLGDISEYVSSVSVINLGAVRFGDLDPSKQITQSEALNLALALQMNRDNLNIMQLVEQMQYAGMEPNTVEQSVRLNKFMSANLHYGCYGDMADNGHVGVRGTRLTNNPNDYDLFCFAQSYAGPLVWIHHNILYDNMKQAGTEFLIERDMKAQDGKLKPKDMPFPERIRDINDYAAKVLGNKNIALAVFSPEPTCNDNTDLDALASEVSSATINTANRIIEEGYVPSDAMPFAFVSPEYKQELDSIIAANMPK
jgi:hypothetical protein